MNDPPSKKELRQRALELVDVERLEGPELCDAFLRAARLVRYDNPRLMISFAEQAVSLAGGLDPQTYGAKVVTDCRCRATLELGNAYRVADRLDEASSTLGEASALWFEGARDELLRAQLFDYQASLYTARRNFAEAARALETAHAIYVGLGETHRAGRALISKGIYCGYEGEHDQAIRLLQEGLGQIDQAKDPGLAASAVQSQASFLVMLGRFLEARELLASHRFPAEVLGARINQLKIRWLESQIQAGLGDEHLAEEGLREVARGFEEEGLYYKSALAGLDLVHLWYRQGRIGEVREVVAGLLKIFLTYRINREPLLALNLLESALEQGIEAGVILDRVTEFVRRAETQAGIKYADWFPG